MGDIKLEERLKFPNFIMTYKFGDFWTTLASNLSALLLIQSELLIKSNEEMLCGSFEYLLCSQALWIFTHIT